MTAAQLERLQEHLQRLRLFKSRDRLEALLQEARPAVGQGTAFVVKGDGTLLTAFHVVRDTKDIKVQCPDSMPAHAVLGETAANTDLAVLRTSRPAKTYLALARARSLRVGDPVFTVGFPATSVLMPTGAGGRTGAGRGGQSCGRTVAVISGPRPVC
jgi:S1-C subfamily serine protease